MSGEGLRIVGLRAELKEKLREIRLILLTVWDPINVGENPALADEYDRYIPDLVRLMNDGASAAEIEACLKRVEGDLGINTGAERRHRAAILLAGR